LKVLKPILNQTGWPEKIPDRISGRIKAASKIFGTAPCPSETTWGKNPEFWDKILSHGTKYRPAGQKAFSIFSSITLYN
jgi:hypothetical protein